MKKSVTRNHKQETINKKRETLNKVEKSYYPGKIEAKWHEIWSKAGTYEPDLVSKGKPFDKSPIKKFQGKPFYNLMMFPYPSAEGLHVGNMYAFVGSDIYGRLKRMQGYDVFEPIGLDGFGIHSENYAMKIGKHPLELSKTTQKNFYRQLNLIGNGFAWSKSLETYDPLYYKWTQWVFVQLFKAGLAYRGAGEVNWCPSCLTVLADEQVLRNSKLETRNSKQIDDIYTCERCGTEVIKKKLTQWYFRITDYAQRLLDGLDKVDWSEKVDVAQRNWLGRSEGAEVVFSIDIDNVYLVPIFTTRPDTLFGVTFLALAVDHPLVTTILKHSNGQSGQAMLEFLDKSDNWKLETPALPASFDREARRAGRRNLKLEGPREGVFTGYYAKHPLTGKDIPVYLASYVLTGYGTGAVMGVPAHDQRDFEFAKKYGIEIKTVVVSGGNKKLETGNLKLETGNPAGRGKQETPTRVGFTQKVHPEGQAGNSEDWDISQNAFTGYGRLVNSEKFSGLSSEEAIRAITDELLKRQIGKKQVNWHLRDWIISRQRYWGPPIPMIFCQKCADKGLSWFDTKDAKNQEIRNPKSEIRNKQSFSTNKSEISNLKLKIKNSMQSMAGWYPVPEMDLPVELPYIEKFKPTGSGVSPLAQDSAFVNTKCPGCLGDAKRETDVSDTFLDSSWYFLRYPSVGNEGPVSGSSHSTSSTTQKTDVDQKDDQSLRALSGTPSAGATHNLEIPWDREVTKRWLPVDMYIGGAEHAVLHLLYARFITKVFYDLGLVDFSSKGGLADEPFSKFRAHGLLIKDGAKMSKSKGNVVNPDDYIAKFGADTLRAYLMFCGRYSEGGDFRDEGMEGMHRFLKRVWKLVVGVRGPVSSFLPNSARSRSSSKVNGNSSVDLRAVGSPSRTATPEIENSNLKLKIKNLKLEPEAQFMMHKTIKKVTEDIESLSYNTAIAALMEWVNFLEKKIVNSSSLIVDSKRKKGHELRTTNHEPLTKEEVRSLLLLLAPFAPHMTEELFQQFFGRGPVRTFPPTNARSSKKSIVSQKDNTELRVGGGPSSSATPSFRSIHLEKWPEFAEELTKQEEITLVIQVNGKVRDKIVTNRGITKDEAVELAKKSSNVSKYVGAGSEIKIIYVPFKIVNIVVSSSIIPKN